MPRHLTRFHETGHYHLVTFSCDGRRAYLREPGAYRVFESTLETMRARHEFCVYGYVLMPEHVHLLVSEPPRTKLSTVLGVVKQESSKKLIRGRKAFWEVRYHDVNLFTDAKASAALRYIHRNSVARGLVAAPEDWPWSSYRHYLTGLPGTVTIESWWTEMARTRLRDLPQSEGS